MNGEKALKFLRFLKKPISESELQDFYDIYKQELDERIAEATSDRTALNNG